MKNIRTIFKRWIPEFIWAIARKIWLGLRNASQWPSAFLHPKRRKSITRLAKFRNVHEGRRAFILGNGPSLAKTDLSRIKDEITFGMNRVYLAFPDWGFESRYFLTVNDLVIEQAGRDIEQLKMPKFLSWRSQASVKDSANTHFLHSTYAGPKFTQDIRGRVWEGATVTYVALQLAYYMGCDPVILIGVDHQFSTKGAPNTTVESQGEDPDHFDARYFGRGFRWQLPDLEMSEIAYKMAREAFEKDGRQILDATIGGKLEIFPKVEYDSLF